MFRKNIAEFTKSARYKQILFITGLIFIILTFFISLNPEPFLILGYGGVFIFSLLGPATFIVPILAPLLNIPTLALVTALGMAINDSVSWYVGALGYEVLPQSAKVKRLEQSVRRWGKIALFFWALIPFPYDLIGLMAGYLGFSFLGFLIPTFAGRFVRFLLLGLGVVLIRN